MLRENQARVMFSLQSQMNSKVNPSWLQAGYPFMRAVIVEGAEGMDHFGWKWWGQQVRDLPQLQLELVDVFHFMLSAILVAHHGHQELCVRELLLMQQHVETTIGLDGKQFKLDEMDVLAKLELLIGLAVVRRMNMSLFASLLTDCGMSWDALYRQYVGKNVLNSFRQEHGYRTGEYRKEWAGREDNQHLVDILAELDSQTGDFRAQVYLRLRERYAETTVLDT